MARLSATVCEQHPLVVLLGPTASGKSRIAVQLAKRFDTEVLAADSRQVYRGMDLGTDKPMMEERQGIPHRLIDLVDPDRPFNSGWYRQVALREMTRLYAARQLPLLVGGTGLYIRTLVRGLCSAPPSDPLVRGELLELVREQGRDGLYARLMEVDPDGAARLHPNDEAKVVRALEVHRLTGQPLSTIQRQHGFRDAPFATLLIGLLRPTETLYRRIEARIDWQLAHGMVEETRALLDRGYGRHLGAMKGLGYRQVAAYLAGEYHYEEMVRRFKRETRRFAKRQVTWFRKEPGIQWVPVDDGESFERTVERVVSLIERFLESLERTSPSGLNRRTMVTEGFA